MCRRDRFENLTVDADTIAQAKKDIAEDGYWGVEKTSDRILDFAKGSAYAAVLSNIRL